MGFQEVQAAFMEHIRDPAGGPAVTDVEDRRLKIYRELFFNNVRGFLSSAFPVIESLLPASEWDGLARAFFKDHDCRSPYFVDISKEFVEYLSERVASPDFDYPFLAELAHYEWLELAISVRKGEVVPWSQNEQWTSVSFSPLAELVSYQWPVSQISETFIPEELLPEPAFFVVARRSNDQVQFTEVNQITAHLLSTVIERETVSVMELKRLMVIALPQLPEGQVEQSTQEMVLAMLSAEILTPVTEV